MYTAPKAGYYRVASKCLRLQPTGKYHSVPNPDRYFFEFWKPKFVVEEIFEVIETMDAQEIRFLKQNEVVNITVFERIQ